MKQVEGNISYTLLIAFPKKSNSKDPAIATKKVVTLNPETVIPNMRFANKPPTNAPITPNKIEPVTPLLSGDGSMALATVPTIKPKSIHERIFIKSPPFLAR